MPTLLANAPSNPIGLNVAGAIIGYAAIWFLLRGRTSQRSILRHRFGLPIALVSVAILRAVFFRGGTDVAFSLWTGGMFAAVVGIVGTRRTSEAEHPSSPVGFGWLAAIVAAGAGFGLAAFGVWFYFASYSERRLDADSSLGSFMFLGLLAGLMTAGLVVVGRGVRIRN